MKTRLVFLYLFLLALLVTGSCRLFEFGGDARMIAPSDVVITEERAVTGFTGIDIRTFGRVSLTQGDSESLTIEGRDNLVPLVKTEVRGGMLIVEMEQPVNIIPTDLEDLLAFTITLRDLTDLTVSGLGDIEMGNLSTSTLNVSMSGAGQLKLGQLTAEDININLSGLGNVEIAGEVNRATIEISGAGEVRAPDLKIQTADVTIPGLGNATIWVTDRLSGNIGGGGTVSYYGDPATSTETTGLGAFKSLGNK